MVGLTIVRLIMSRRQALPEVEWYNGGERACNVGPVWRFGEVNEIEFGDESFGSFSEMGTVFGGLLCSLEDV
jgi:hypothetical protein